MTTYLAFSYCVGAVFSIYGLKTPVEGMLRWVAPLVEFIVSPLIAPIIIYGSIIYIDKLIFKRLRGFCGLSKNKTGVVGNVGGTLG